MNKVLSGYVAKLVEVAANNQRKVVFGQSGTDVAWKNGIKPRPGWYFIKTNAPLDVFPRCTLPPLAEGGEEKRIDLPVRIHQTNWVDSLGLAVPYHRDGYVIYNGEAKRLSDRIGHHYKGGSTTGCISFATYTELRQYDWWVSHAYLEDVFPELLTGDRDAAVRVALEQAWRARFGWPRLCLDLHRAKGRPEYESYLAEQGEE